MVLYNRFCCVLLLAFVTKVSGGTVGRPSDVENNPRKDYSNNPFLENLSFPEEQNRRYHYGHYHSHHHHDNDFYHNSNDNFNHNQNVENYSNRGGNPDNFQNADPDDPVISFPQNRQNNLLSLNRGGNTFMDYDFNGSNSDGPKITSRRDTAAEEDFPNYPFDEIRGLLDTNPLLKRYFAKIIILGNRNKIDDVPDESESLCKMQSFRTYYPKTLKNVNEVEKLIVNDEKDYRQGVEQAKCVDNGGKCNIPFDNFGYTSYCHQKFDTKRLMVYDNVTKQMVFDEFPVPSCCVCKVKRVK